jgi:hypothetical protein
LSDFTILFATSQGGLLHRRPALIPAGSPATLTARTSPWSWNIAATCTVNSGSPLASALGARVAKSTTGSGGAIATSVMALVSTGSRTVASLRTGPTPRGGIEHVYGKDRSIRADASNRPIHTVVHSQAHGTGLDGTQCDQTGREVT